MVETAPFAAKYVARDTTAGETACRSVSTNKVDKTIVGKRRDRLFFTIGVEVTNDQLGEDAGAGWVGGKPRLDLLSSSYAGTVAISGAPVIIITGAATAAFTLPVVYGDQQFFPQAFITRLDYPERLCHGHATAREYFGRRSQRGGSAGLFYHGSVVDQHDLDLVSTGIWGLDYRVLFPTFSGNRGDERVGSAVGPGIIFDLHEAEDVGVQFTDSRDDLILLALKLIGIVSAPSVEGGEVVQNVHAYYRQVATHVWGAGWAGILRLYSSVRGGLEAVAGEAFIHHPGQGGQDRPGAQAIRRR